VKGALAKALLAFAAEGIKEGAKALLQWAREKREKRESDMEHWRSIQERHVPRPPRDSR
jgi:hypothetical protein